MNYILKFADTWTLLNGKKMTSRALSPVEIEHMQPLFIDLEEDETVGASFQISLVNANKLMSIPVASPAIVTKKAGDSPAKS
jgi:hypothetical protein